MSFAEFLADVVDSVAWPIVVIVALLVLKKPLRALIGRVKSAKGYGLELDFEEVADEAKDGAESVLNDLQQQAAGLPSVAGGQPMPTPEPVHVPPNEEPVFAVISAWERVGGALRDLAGAAALGPKLSLNQMRSPVAIAHLLGKHGIVNDRFVDSVRQLSQLRNAAAHGRHVSYDEAEAYVAAANELIRAIAAIIDFRFKTDASVRS